MSNTWRHFAKKASLSHQISNEKCWFLSFCAVPELCHLRSVLLRYQSGLVLFCIRGFWMACKSIINFISIRCTWDFLIRPTISLHNSPVNLFKMSTTTFFVFCSRFFFNWMNVIIRQILKSKLELNFRFVETLYITVPIFVRNMKSLALNCHFYARFMLWTGAAYCQRQ